MNAIDLNNRTAVVTGGAQGIGHAIAERLQSSGARVALWDIDAARVADSAAKLKCASAVVDVADEASVEEGVRKTLATLGRIDILVNNAGITGPNAKTWDYPVADFRRVIEVDLVSAFLVCRTVVPHMIANRYGRIVNVASVAGKEGNPNAPAYSAAKAGLIGFTKSLGKETVGTGVVVNCVTPAAAKTALFDQMTQQHIDFMLSKIPMGRFVAVEEIAAMVAWLSSEECSFSTGAVFDISGGRATY
jgi:2-dehydro-3-deoxy-L-rhamnonate dehydrogenase (NAD+)